MAMVRFTTNSIVTTAGRTTGVICPADYDLTAITERDIQQDACIVDVGDDRFVLATGEDADQWSRHASLKDARDEADAEPDSVWSIWRIEDYVMQTGRGPVWRS